jgi:hypothetical protein
MCGGGDIWELVGGMSLIRTSGISGLEGKETGDGNSNLLHTSVILSGSIERDRRALSGQCTRYLRINLSSRFIEAS